MGTGGGAVEALVALPSHEAVDGAEHPDEDEPDIKIFHFSDLERVEERFIGWCVGEGGRDVVPTEETQERDGDDEEHDVGEEALDAVGDHDGELSRP